MRHADDRAMHEIRFAWALALVAGCASFESPRPPPGTPCTDDAACGGATCDATTRVCTARCEIDADCPAGWACRSDEHDEHGVIAVCRCPVDPSHEPDDETCDGEDDDCDGRVDEMVEGAPALCSAAQGCRDGRCRQRAGGSCANDEDCFDGACDPTTDVCVLDCPTGGTVRQCGPECVDTAADRRHCGRCDHACAEGASCSDGLCGFVQILEEPSAIIDLESTGGDGCAVTEAGEAFALSARADDPPTRFYWVPEPPAPGTSWGGDPRGECIGCRAFSAACGEPRFVAVGPGALADRVFSMGAPVTIVISEPSGIGPIRVLTDGSAGHALFALLPARHEIARVDLATGTTTSLPLPAPGVPERVGAFHRWMLLQYPGAAYVVRFDGSIDGPAPAPAGETLGPAVLVAGDRLIVAALGTGGLATGAPGASLVHALETERPILALASGSVETFYVEEGSLEVIPASIEPEGMPRILRAIGTAPPDVTRMIEVGRTLYFGSPSGLYALAP